MRIRTAEQYRAKHRWTAPKVRRSDYLPLVPDGARGLKPDHASRAVSIAVCFPPLGSVKGGRPYHASESTYATPLNSEERTGRYHRQNGAKRLTARQARRIGHKEQRAAR